MRRSYKEYSLGIGAVLVISLLAWLITSFAINGSVPFFSSDESQAGEYRSGSYRLHVEIEPATPRAGSNELAVQVRDSQGMNVNGASVRVVLEQADAEADNAKASLQEFTIYESSPGIYTSQFDLPGEGEWPLLIEVKSTDGGHADLSLLAKTGVEGLALLSATPEGETRYTCSMHPSVSQSEPGSCPICGMDLTPVTMDPQGIAYHTCPMHPSIRNASAGQCPICGMDLTPVTNAEKASGSIIVDQRRRQLIGLKTATVTRGDLHDTLRLIGEVEYDPAAMTDISLPHDGKVGKLFVVYEGTSIKAGDPLFTVSSPLLYQAETDLVRLLQDKSKARESDIESARQRLLSFGLDSTDISELEKTLKPRAYRTIHSPAEGVLVKSNIVAGSVFWLGDPLMQVAKQSAIRIKASAYESDIKYIHKDMPVVVSVPYVTEQQMPGEVDYIGPVIREHDHTADVFVTADWGQVSVLARSYADVFVDMTIADQLLVPEQSVIYSGDSRVVFVDQGEGRLQPRHIKTGRRNNEYVQVLEGLKEGETVVTSGNFLLASESKLKSGIDQW